MLQETKPTASRKATKVRKSPAVKKALVNIAREAGIGKRKDFTAYDVKTPKRAKGAAARQPPWRRAIMWLYTGQRRDDRAARRIASRRSPKRPAAASSAIESGRNSGQEGPQRVASLIGAVVRGPFGTGSKSERQAVWFETAEGRFVLRRKEGPTFGDRDSNNTWASG